VVGMNYIIREANEDDISALLDVRNNEELFQNYLHQQKYKEVHFVVAEENQIIIGFGLLKLNSGLKPKLSDLYVKEDCRGQGVGTDLIRYRENIARSLGYSEIFVSVDPIENPKMIKLITKLRYEKLTESYSRTALFHNEDGTTIEKTYTRIDLKKTLS
jgi:N-acetylglutamate synthase-like GNAT family acetyltransferase